MSSQIQIEKLGKNNYDTWVIQMEALAIKNGNFGYIDNSIPCPKPITLNDTNGAAVEKRNEERYAWVQASLKAKSDIILSIKPSELIHTKGCKYANRVWAKLFYLNLFNNFNRRSHTPRFLP